MSYRGQFKAKFTLCGIKLSVIELLSDIWFSTLEIGAARCRFLAETAPKSPSFRSSPVPRATF